MTVRNPVAVFLFTLVAVASFSCWAFGTRLFPSEPVLYTACAVVFLGFGGIALLPGLPAPQRKPLRFGLSFAFAFLLYAFLWSIVWFTLPETFGEVVGSTLGLTAFTAVLRRRHDLNIPLATGVAVVFLHHTVGYYAGGFTYEMLQGRGPVGVTLNAAPNTVRTLARLSWGVFYGIGLGTGILALFYTSRSSDGKPSTQI